ncbi:hypothetical protein AMTRI_Chr03g138240 [Amborella trichopoda]
MASFLTSLNLFSLKSLDLSPFNTSTCALFPKSPYFSKTKPNKIEIRRFSQVQAVAKFKGTQMREQKLTEMIEKKITEAKEVCKGDLTSDECKVAWDEVEEVSQAKADLRRKMEKEDPLESFCQENPETDECRIYDD